MITTAFHIARLAGTALLGFGPALGAAQAGVYSLGHGDWRIYFNGTQLEQKIHLDPTSIIDGVEAGNDPDGVEYSPEHVTVLVPESVLRRPEGAEWDFIATAAGAPVWYIPEVQEFDRPWLGSSSETLGRSDWSDFRISLICMSGPPRGQFSLIDSGGDFFARVFLATGDGITAADSFTPILGSHAHYSWLFTQPGEYDITLRVGGNHVTAGTLASTATYRFAVVPEPNSAVLALSGAVALFGRRRFSFPPHS